MVENVWLSLYRSAMEGRHGKQHGVIIILSMLFRGLANLVTKTKSRCTFPPGVLFQWQQLHLHFSKEVQMHGQMHCKLNPHTIAMISL